MKHKINPLLILALFLTASLIIPIHAQDTDTTTASEPNALGASPQRWNSIAARNAIKDVHEVDRLQLEAQKSAEVAKFIDLAEKTLGLLEETLPKALEHYDALLRDEEGLLHGNEGRFLAQNEDFIETILRWTLETRLPLAGGANPTELDDNRIDFGEKERLQRIALVKQAIAKLNQNTGETFSAEKSPTALSVISNSNWASKAFNLVDSRIALLEGYLTSVPKNADVSKLPTLEEEIKSTFARRISTFENQLNEVERNAHERRSGLISDATAQMRETELQDHLKNMGELFDEQRKLDQVKADAEIQEVSIEADKLREQIEAEYQLELAAKDERAEELMKELKARDLEIERVKGEIKGLEGRLKIAEAGRVLPENTKILLNILSTPGHWAPIPSTMDAYVFKGDGRYEGLDPQPHSLKTLAASGALDNSSLGVYYLYLIMATDLDKDRPRYQKLVNFRDSNIGIIRLNKTADQLLTSSDEMKATTKKLQEIQKLINSYGEELVEKGILAP